MNPQNTAPKRGKVLILAGIFLLIFGSIFGLVGNSLINSERAYENDGTTVPGTVVGKNIETRRDSDNKGTSTYYYLKYKFTPEGASEIEGSGSVDSTLYEQKSPGDHISVQYLRHDPGSNRIAQKPSFVIGYVFLAIGVLLGGCGVATLLYDIKMRRLYSRLNRDGMMVEGTVTSVEPGSLTINNVTQWRVSYTFRDMKGQEISGKTPHMDPDTAMQWESGDKGKVKYDRNNSSLNIWLG